MTLDCFKILEKTIRISNSTIEIDRRLKSILQLIRRELGASRAVIFHYDRDDQSLVIRTTEDDIVLPEIHIRLQDNCFGTALIKREAILSEQPQTPTEKDLRLFALHDHLSAFPLMDDQILYGVLAISTNEDIRRDEEWVDLIKTISREIAGTMRNSRLYTDSKKRITELNVLYDVGRAVSSTLDLDKVLNTVVNITCKVLQAEGCALNVLDTTTGKLRVSAESGVIPRGCRFKHFLDTTERNITPQAVNCVSRREPYIGPAKGCTCYPGLDEEDREKSVICLPIPFKGGFKGNLLIFNKISSQPGQPKIFTRDDLELMTTMGAMISSSLENALTFQAVEDLARKNERLVQNLTCLYEISSSMMTTVKMDELLNIIANALTLGQGFNFDRALLFVINEEEDRLSGAAIREVPSEKRGLNGKALSDRLKEKPGPQSQRHPHESLFLKYELPLKRGSGILAQTALEKKSFVIRGPERGPLADPELPVVFGRKSCITVPLLAKDNVVGVIAVDRDFSDVEPGEEDLRNLSMLANQAGLAIENSRLYEYIEQSNLALSQTKERLIEAEKLAALGEMAAGMAHEIRNPLVSIGGFTRRLLKSMEYDSPHRVYIEVIINEVTRLEKTLSEILDFSRDTMGHLEERDLNDVISESLHIFRRELKEGRIEVLKELTPLPVVLIDERQVKHVFFNLFYNAGQAMEHGGTLKIRTFPTYVDDRLYAAAEVSDTGPGISAEVLPNIFNPFFTTKDTGTGLGLSIVHKIISRHHGFIDVTNKNEGGAKFVIKIPVAAQAGLYLK
jgi:two-component system, NtrC family, sensor histidine kinase HydH